MWLCGTSSITSMARMWYAFARDDGMPGSRLIKQIHPRFRTPVWSIVITSALAVLLCVYAAAFAVVRLVLWTVIAVAVALTLYWRLHAKRRFPGPHPSNGRSP